MTTIAFDGTTLAADRAAWSGGNNKYRVRKVERITATDGRRYLVAFSGECSYASALLAWMKGGAHPGAYPESDNVVIAVVVDERLRIWRLNSTLRYSRVLERVHASGGGQDFAIGALEAGASARRAVQIAIKRSDYAGLGVDSVRFG